MAGNSKRLAARRAELQREQQELEAAAKLRGLMHSEEKSTLLKAQKQTVTAADILKPPVNPYLKCIPCQIKRAKRKSRKR